jgi:hypothetical protein
MIFLVSKYTFLHKIDKFYVNLNDRRILVTGNNFKKEAIVFWTSKYHPKNLFFEKYLRIGHESYYNLRHIIKDQNDPE